MGHGSVSHFIQGWKAKYARTLRKDGRECCPLTQCRSRRSDVEGADEEFVNSREELLTKGFVRTVVLVEEYVSDGVVIPEGSNLRCSGSDRNTWCCTRIQQGDKRGGQQIIIDGGRDSEVQEAEGSVTEVGLNQRCF